ncbi:uncharacterized protein BDW70DRAFT_110062 [Aspergillus foveolatus]|uniref:uncharacterized protein n=1 Tax=Aspergillus foveolatus TaxID=210207 RepID=UPI003CCD4943
MAFKLVLLLVACLLVCAGCANEIIGNHESVIDGLNIVGHLGNDKVDVDGSRAKEGPVLAPREVATVTVTETVCGPVGSTSAGGSPIISVPETTLATDTSGPSSAPSAVQPPATSQSSGADGATSAEPTSAEASPSSSQGQATTTLQTSSAASGTSTSADSSEAPTTTSVSPTSTDAPAANAGFTKGGMSSVILAVALTFVRIFGV